MVNADLRIAVNQFRNAAYAFALLTLRNAHSMRVLARSIPYRGRRAQVIVKIGPEMSTVRELSKPKVETQSCQSANCCTAFLMISWLVINDVCPV